MHLLLKFYFILLIKKYKDENIILDNIEREDIKKQKNRTKF